VAILQCHLCVFGDTIASTWVPSRHHYPYLGEEEGTRTTAASALGTHLCQNFRIATLPPTSQKLKVTRPWSTCLIANPMVGCNCVVYSDGEGVKER